MYRNKFLKKRNLELFLERIPEAVEPKLKFEQYTIPSDLAATILWIIAFGEKRIEGKKVLDLGCGTGRLGLGAAVLGAQLVVGVDIDYRLVSIAHESAKKLGLVGSFEAVCADVSLPPFRCKVDVVIQNPPFGVYHKGYDLKFLKSAFQLSSIVYSLHKSTTVDYIRDVARKEGWESRILMRDYFRIKQSYWFHRKKSHLVKVALIAFEKVA
ncbi:MAG: methylase [Thermoprotei archaeon]|nr:MAG: methylase [Thermoprotei archaeon]